MIEWRQQYADPARDESLGLLSAIDCSDSEDMTLQSFAEDADINVLLRRFGVTGELPISRRVPFTGDFSSVQDYQSALNLTLEAERSFLTLPSELRKRLDNDPARYIEWMQDPANAEEIYTLGLAERKAAPEPIPVRVLQDAPESA